MSDIKLSLENQPGNRQTQNSGRPIAGYMALVFGLLGIFSVGYVFVPLTFIAAIVALFAGQIIWGIFGMLLGFAGILTSPVLLTFLGVAWVLTLF